MSRDQKKLEKLRDQNEFLKDMLEALEDVKYGRVSEYKFSEKV